LACASEIFASLHDSFFPLALVVLVCVRLHDRDHAAVGLGDNLLVLTWCFGKFRRRMLGLEDGLGVAQRDPLDRAFPDLEAVMLAQFQRNLGEWIIRREIHDGALQRPRTPARIHLGAQNEGAHTLVFEPILRF
jgi:hypothetical protein